MEREDNNLDNVKQKCAEECPDYVEYSNMNLTIPTYCCELFGGDQYTQEWIYGNEYIGEGIYSPDAPKSYTFASED